MGKSFFIMKENDELVVIKGNHFYDCVCVNENPIMKEGALDDFNFVSRFHSASLFNPS
ncbi:hypothetical protein LEP1GSC016_4219 [Leptospira borgpetersenii serovar Hardjo-bovis str. Sponselee]|uniref:Uncharacterized protein n=2 Tax=Leptospira borgpetersenii TaxID=174 RepID=M6BM37_LEPBO|nr:hypothetical protein LEP1GSC016_4219 [Leptospira borgpetersenii serovar Hardjo-bovis str. Sponselee]EMO63532.1 hypothetical protein LEP1GSC133_4675 [Leptospira borgpetersenii serovar Pomona str. 200901868]